MPQTLTQPRIDICPQGLDNLRIAIVQQAAVDYAAAYMGHHIGALHSKAALYKLEKFFKSEYYKLLTGGKIDGEWIMNEIKIKELSEAIEAYERALSSTSGSVIRLNLPKTKTLDKKVFIVPPALVDNDFRAAMLKGLERMRDELKRLRKENDEIEAVEGSLL